MPLPNADKDKRLYELLKTQDLENLSYADFKGAAEKIFVEGVNEDDLRRVVLIQLARMAVAGEWNGFTSSGGGGSGSIDYGFGNVMNSSNQIWVASDAAPYGGSGNTTSTLGTNYQMCYPFVSPVSGNIDNLHIRVNSGATNTLFIGIYADSGSGYPTTKIGGTTSIDCSVAGYLSASPASTVTLVAGTKYWMVYSWQSNYAGAGASPTVWIQNAGNSAGWNSNMGQAPKTSISTTTGSTNSLPSTMPTSDYTAAFNKKLRCGIEFA